MGKLLLKISLIPAAFLWSATAHADKEITDSVYQVPQVVVSATRTLVNRNNVPLSISVVNRREIEESSESALLPVLSQRIPGLFVTQRGITGFGVSTGGSGEVNIRGVGGGNKVLMLFDGQPQWAGVFGHSLPDTYVASDVERVEVIRGPGSLLYGSNAMGGVVNIITRTQQTDGADTHIRAMYGSYNTQKYMINNGFKSGRFNSFISVNHDRTDGHRSNSEFHITNGFLNLGYDINKYLKTTGSVSLASSNSYNPGKVSAPMIDNWMNILRGTASVALENQCAKSNGAVRFFYNWGDHKINDGHLIGTPAMDFLFRSNDHNYGLLLYQSFSLFRGNQFTVGLDYKNWGGNAWNDKLDGTRSEIVDKQVDEAAGYLIMRQYLLKNLILSAGLRYEHNSTFGSEWVPQAGLIYHPFSGNTIKFSFSKGFRSPNLRELYMFAPAANPDLKPESMLNYELSIGQYFLDGRLSAELTGFWIDGKNMIQMINRHNVNSGTFTNKGVELDANYRLSKKWNFDMNYSYLHTSKPIVAAPGHKLFAGVNFTPGNFSFTVNVQSIFDLYVIGGAIPVKENYTLLNARAAYRLDIKKNKRYITFFVKGENLTNTTYTINNGYPMPGAIAMGGIDFKF